MSDDIKVFLSTVGIILTLLAIAFVHWYFTDKYQIMLRQGVPRSEIDRVYTQDQEIENCSSVAGITERYLDWYDRQQLKECEAKGYLRGN